MTLSDSREAYALSCVGIKGDKVINELGNASMPLWFGQAKLIDVYEKMPVNQNADLIAVYEIEDTYLLTGDAVINDRVYVEVPGIHRRWGIWSNKEISDSDAGEYMFSLKGNGAWGFSAPGMCTYFSKKEWAGLKAGDYKNYLSMKNKDNKDAN